VSLLPLRSRRLLPRQPARALHRGRAGPGRQPARGRGSARRRQHFPFAPTGLRLIASTRPRPSGTSFCSGGPAALRRRGSGRDGLLPSPTGSCIVMRPGRLAGVRVRG